MNSNFNAQNSEVSEKVICHSLQQRTIKHYQGDSLWTIPSNLPVFRGRNAVGASF